MALSDYKVTDALIASKGVVAAPNKLVGNAEDNKKVFDRLIREGLKGNINSVIDLLVSTAGAGEIGVVAITGVTGDDIQTVLSSLKAILDTKAGDTATTTALALKSDKSVTDLHFKNVGFDGDTGIFTFTREDGTAVTIDTALEKVATNWAYDPDTQSLVLTLADGSTQSVSLSAFITELEFEDSAQIDFTANNHKVTATIKAGSITDTMLSSALIAALDDMVDAAAASASAAHQDEEAAKGFKNAASSSATAADGSAKDAEAWAVGQRGGEDVGGADPAYHNNAKYYADDARDSAAAAAGDATDAGNAKDAAEDSAEDAEAWAVGQRDGEDVPNSDPTYHNNAKYWAEVAEQAAGGGVTSFNGRTGVVVPQAGDYTPDMVGAAAEDSGSNVAFTIGVDAGGLYIVTPDE